MENIAKEALMRIVTGIVVFVIAYFLIVWIEKQLAKRYKDDCGCGGKPKYIAGEEFVPVLPDWNLIG